MTALRWTHCHSTSSFLPPPSAGPGSRTPPTNKLERRPQRPPAHLNLNSSHPPKSTPLPIPPHNLFEACSHYDYQVRDTPPTFEATAVLCSPMDASAGGDATGSRGGNVRGNAPSFRPGRGGRGRTGNRGKAVNKQNATARNAADPSNTQTPASDIPANPTAQKLAAVARPLNNPIDDSSVPDDAELCFICANVVSHHSIAPCNHTTCHICGLRMRALYKDQNCAHCRVRSVSAMALKPSLTTSLSSDPSSVRHLRQRRHQAFRSIHRQRHNHHRQ